VKWCHCSKCGVCAWTMNDVWHTSLKLRTSPQNSLSCILSEPETRQFGQESVPHYGYYLRQAILGYITLNGLRRIVTIDYLRLINAFTYLFTYLKQIPSHVLGLIIFHLSSNLGFSESSRVINSIKNFELFIYHLFITHLSNIIFL